MKLKDRVAVVTGGVSGIGLATSLMLAREGATVVANYSRSENDAASAARALQEVGARHLVVKADVSVEAEVKAMLDQVLAAFGRVDILVNNAGTSAYVSFMECDAATWDRVMAVNVRGTFLCTQQFGRAMIAGEGGCIVNIASRSAFGAVASSPAYVVSKAGVVTLTRVSAVALAPKVRVNCVAPGFIETPWYTKAGEDLDRLSAEAADKAVLARTGKPEDIASVILFLVSDESSFMSGQTLVADGGRVMR